MPLERVAVLGAGGMGTVMACRLARTVPGVRLWGRDAGRVAELAATRRNARHLPEAVIPELVEVTADAATALEDVGLVVAAIPSAYLRATVRGLGVPWPAGVPVLSVIKGLEPGTYSPPSAILAEEMGSRPFAVLSGPAHAEELAAGLPASLVVAGAWPELNNAVREALADESMRIYTNPDGRGVELAGALKNVLAVAAGIAEGLGLGDNAKAALLTRGLSEFSRFVVALGGDERTPYGLAGIGDLLTTCYSPHGRNRAVGLALGRGAALGEVLAKSTNVAEGVTTCRAVLALAEAKGVEVPITREVVAVLHEGKSPRAALVDLMRRSPKDEWE